MVLIVSSQRMLSRAVLPSLSLSFRFQVEIFEDYFYRFDSEGYAQFVIDSGQSQGLKDIIICNQNDAFSLIKNPSERLRVEWK